MESLDTQDQMTSYDLPRRGMEHKVLLLSALKGRKKPAARKKVLVIEQDDITRTKLCLMLMSCGYEPVPAESRSALDMYKKLRESGVCCYSVIIDINPVNSAKTVQRLLKFDPHAKIIACCSDSNQTRTEFRKNPFTGILLKPYRIAQLRKALA